MITASVLRSCNLTKAFTGSAIFDFVVLKAFKIDTHHAEAPKILEVFWQPPIHNWFKCNTDGASLGTPRQSALFVELMRVMLVVEIAFE